FEIPSMAMAGFFFLFSSVLMPVRVKKRTPGGSGTKVACAGLTGLIIYLHNALVGITFNIKFSGHHMFAPHTLVVPDWIKYIHNSIQDIYKISLREVNINNL